MRAVAVSFLVAACGQPAAVVDDSPGGRLERAAVARGLVADPARAALTGAWGGDTDRLCVVSAGKELRLGAAVDYGDGQGCSASGTVERNGDRLRVRFGDCRFDAAFDGERIAFPAELPVRCNRLCTGRATLSVLTVERLSDSGSEAAMVRDPGGRPLCRAD